MEITDGPPSLTKQNSATFTFSSENGASVTCKLNGSDFAGCESPRTYENLPDGEHTFTARATNTAGNSATDSRAWTIDATPPNAPTVALDPSSDTGSSNEDRITKDDTPTFIGEVEPGSIVEVSKDGAPLGETTADENGLWNFTATAAFSEGDHDITATATDSAGNVSGPSGALTVTIDTQAPETTIDDGPVGTVSATSASFELSANEQGASFRCKLDGLDSSPCDSPQSYTNLGDGEHTFGVSATDLAGNKDPSPAERNWTVDAPLPETPTLSLDEASDAGSSDGTAEPGATIEIFDGATSLGTTTASEEGDWSFTVPAALSEGDHDIIATAANASGVSEPSEILTITIDTQSPEVEITEGPPGLTDQVSATLAFTSEEGATFACDLDGDGFEACVSPR